MSENGIALIEFLVALGLAGILFVSGLELIGPSLRIIESGKEYEQAASLLEKHLEIVRSIRNENWGALTINGTYHYERDVDGGLYLASGSSTTGIYEIGIILSDVYRNGDGDIYTSANPDEIDSMTREVKVQIVWTSYGRPKTVERSMYLTDWGGF